jgi:hypothetical protein
MVDLEDKELGTQINDKFTDISSADENKYKSISVEPLFKNCTKTIHLFIDRRLTNYTCSKDVIMLV